MKNKWTVAIVLGCIVFLVLAYWIGKSYGKSLPPKESDISGSANPDGDLPANRLSDTDVSEIADAIYKDIEGWTVSHDDEPYTRAIKANDLDLTRIYNTWNNRYFSKWDQDLIDAMKGEKYGVMKPTTDIIIIRLTNIKNAGK